MKEKNSFSPLRVLLFWVGKIAHALVGECLNVKAIYSQEICCKDIATGFVNVYANSPALNTILHTYQRLSYRSLALRLCKAGRRIRTLPLNNISPDLRSVKCMMKFEHKCTSNVDKNTQNSDNYALNKCRGFR